MLLYELKIQRDTSGIWLEKLGDVAIYRKYLLEFLLLHTDPNTNNDNHPQALN